MSSDSRVGRVVSALFAVLVGLVAREAAAQETSGGLEEVVVTAQKRSQSLQTVPMSITAFTSDDLQRAGVSDFRDYAVHVPNLSFSYTNSLSQGAQSPALRGIFGVGTTGMYLDDTPLPASIDPDTADLERIEVLRGPQGTLYGARSMGGTIRLITQQPDAEHFSGKIHVSASDTRQGSANQAVDGALNVPLADGVLAVRGSGFYRYESGIYDRAASPDAPVNYGIHKNIDADTHSGGQIALRLNLLNDALTITPRVVFEDIKTDGRPEADYRAGNFTQYRLFDQNEPGKGNWWLYTLTAQYKTGVGEFTSATSVLNRRFNDSEDFSELAELLIGPVQVPAVIRATAGNDSFAQEARFSSDFAGPLQLTAGVFYQRQKSTTVFPPTPVFPYFANIFSQNLATQVNERAVFGEATLTIAERYHLIAGARRFTNEVTFTGAQDGALVFPDTFAGVQRETGTNPKLSIEFQATSEANVYATASKGFRIGGVNSLSNRLCAADLAALGLTSAQVQTYNSDSLWNYEIGAKTSWLNHRVVANGAVFDIDWSNVQQNVALPTCGFFLTMNAGKARSRGFELELSAAVAEGLVLSLGTGYTDAVITNGGSLTTIVPGTPVQQVPRWTVSASADYDVSVARLPVFLHMDYADVGSSHSANNDPINQRLRPAYSLVNLRAGVNFTHWNFALFADNVFDKAANLSDIPPLAIEYPGRPRIVTNRPRTLGVETRYTFR